MALHTPRIYSVKVTLTSLGDGHGISMILSFPISFGILLLALFLLNIIRSEIALRKAGMGGALHDFKNPNSIPKIGDI